MSAEHSLPERVRGDPPRATDAELIEMSVAEPERFAALFCRHAPELQRYAMRRLGPAKADDVVAETFLHAFRQRARYSHDWPDARPWLYGIATNLISRQRRAEVRQYRAFARTGVDPVLTQFTDEADARVSAGSLDLILAASLAKLPSAQREALLLVAWAELSYEETARALGVPVGTVRSRVSRARARLRTALESGHAAEAGNTPEAGHAAEAGRATAKPRPATTP